MRPIAAVALLIVAQAASAQDCTKIMRDDKKLECIDRASSRQRRAYDQAKAKAEAKSPHVDKYGRKLARLTLAGISKEAEARALPGDRLKEGVGVNNISINYRNSGQQVWGSFKSVIYTPVYDEATKHYSGFENLQILVGSEKPKDPNPSNSGKIKLFSGVNFDDPVEFRIRAQTVNNNYFWTQFTAKVEGDENVGFTVPGSYTLDHYSHTEGKDDAPIAAAAAPAAAAAAAPAHTPAPVGVAAPAAPAAVAAAEPPPVRSQEDMIGYRPSQGSFAEIKVMVGGVSPKLKATLAEDPLSDKKRMVRVYFKNEGADKWATFKYLTFREGDPTKIDLEAVVSEGRKLSLQKPIIVRVEAQSQAKKFYWQEVRRTEKDLSAPIVLENYGDESRAD